MVTIDKIFALFVLGLGTWIFMMDNSSFLALMIWILSIGLYLLVGLRRSRGSLYGYLREWNNPSSQLSLTSKSF